VLQKCQATIINKSLHKFEPQGLSIIYLLAESHLSIHTWPELKSCSIDFYHCGKTSHEKLLYAKELLQDLLSNKDTIVKYQIITRGSGLNMPPTVYLPFRKILGRVLSVIKKQFLNIK
jgi:S-adenosylmethionine decarboxylase proenzyme